ncbi:MAG: hypothetical protein ABI599_13705 [Flavobacteriales bacterium]
MTGKLLTHMAWVAVFAIAMAYLESAVVVYLRALFFPQGFTFPLPVMDRSIVITEVGREIATIVMLVAPGALLARSGTQRFAWFLFAFGVWDIFYYIWLKILLGWPASLFAMDILFLVPVPWVGPVIAPCLISLGFVLLAVVVLHGSGKNPGFRIQWQEWALLCAGSASMLWSFTGDHVVHTIRHGGNMLNNGPAYMLRDAGMEAAFSWIAFLSGACLALAAVARTVRRALR